jgi:hypothetical protein
MSSAYKQYTEAVDGSPQESSEPIFGGSNILITPGHKVNGVVKVKYLVANMDSPNDVTQVEAINTKSLTCRDLFFKIGDIVMLNEVGTFDKNGTYHLVIKYAEIEPQNTEASTTK